MMTTRSGRSLSISPTVVVLGDRSDAPLLAFNSSRTTDREPTVVFWTAWTEIVRVVTPGGKVRSLARGNRVVGRSPVPPAPTW